jgi:hypothetical protein
MPCRQSACDSVAFRNHISGAAEYCIVTLDVLGPARRRLYAAHGPLQRTCARSQPCCQVSHTMADLKNCPTCRVKWGSVLSLKIVTLTT